MEEQYYRIVLNDYAKPAFVTFDKSYYGTIQQVRSFVGAMEQDKRTKREHAQLIQAFREFELGNEIATHPVGFRDVQLMIPVRHSKSTTGQSLFRLAQSSKLSSCKLLIFL